MTSDEMQWKPHLEQPPNLTEDLVDGELQMTVKPGGRFVLLQIDPPGGVVVIEEMERLVKALREAAAIASAKGGKGAV